MRFRPLWMIMLACVSVPATHAAASDPSSPGPRAKRICKTFAETGSFAKKRRICMTAAQWQEVFDQTRGELREAAERSLINSRRPAGGG